MGTRTGDMDPAVVLHVMNQLKLWVPVRASVPVPRAWPSPRASAASPCRCAVYVALLRAGARAARVCVNGGLPTRRPTTLLSSPWTPPPLPPARTTFRSTKETDTLLNKKSGLLGICGHSDLRSVIELGEKGDARCQLALDVFVYRVRKVRGGPLRSSMRCGCALGWVVGACTCAACCAPANRALGPTSRPPPGRAAVHWSVHGRAGRR
jgi:hypothetical protein